MAKMGRPFKHIDKDQFEKLCSIQATIIESCAFFDCDENTLEDWCRRTYGQTFSQIFAIKRGHGRISLRRKQFEAALSGNTTMLVWLGKQYLSQSDKIENENTNVHEIKAPTREVSEENISELISKTQGMLESLLDKQKEIEQKRVENARLVEHKPKTNDKER